MTMKLHSTGLAIALIMGGAATVKAQALGPTVYNNIPSTVPLNVFSQGAQAYAFVESGDGFKLAAGSGSLGTVTVIMQSWACQSGNWQNGPGPNACVTTPGATYPVPVTVNVYSVVPGTSLEGAAAPAPGMLLATATKSFNMPYRPSSNFVDCPASASESSGYYEWYNATTQTCQDGIDFPITFDLTSQGVWLPSQIIVTFSYNTTNYGPHPYGTLACDSTTQGCFYDSLNISGGAGAATFPGAVLAPSTGSVLNVNGIFTKFASANTALCGTGTLPADTLALDASPGCYTGNHPMIEVTLFY
jgi:hypothetical protein